MSRHVISFKLQFVPMVESGQKRQTIRAPRKRPIKVGDTLLLVTGARTKHYRKLGEAECTKVFPIWMSETGIRTTLTGWTTGPFDELVLADGFDNVADFRAFFERQYGFPFEGVVIRWGQIRKGASIKKVMVKCYHRRCPIALAGWRKAQHGAE